MFCRSTPVQRVAVIRGVVGAATATNSSPHTRTIASVARNPSQENKLKVAIVGGGPAGLCAALHLAPLVSNGILQGPIDVYEAKAPYVKHTPEKRETIGVGLWSTALLPFLRSHSDSNFSNKHDEQRQSYKMLLQQLVSVGCFVTNVGYRTPNGSWITQTTLSSNNLVSNNENINMQQPSLLFLQRHNLLKALYDAIFTEGQQTIHMHYGHKIQSITQCGRDYEATLSYVKEEHEENGHVKNTKPYNLIIVAEGMDSNLRRLYSTHINDSPTKQQHNNAKQDTGTSTIFTCNDDVEDRGYYVFRANTTANSGIITDSFQTWGEKNSMRFAVVPCYMLPNSNSICSNSRPFEPAFTNEVAPQQTENLQPIQRGYTWFFTTNDPSYDYENINSPRDRKDRILESLRHWHNPICDLIQSTRAEDIIMERAVAHRTSASALGARFERENSVSRLPPIVCFIGDSDMTVDPVLAQGITIGMEDAACVAKCIEHAFLATKQRHIVEVVKEELIQRHQIKMEGRLKCLLNATNLVQSLAQPSDKLTELLARFLVRPLATHVIPELIKRKCFHWLMKYSLGLLKKVIII